jgi:hypothetical protein
LLKNVGRRKHSDGFSHKIHFHICRRFVVTPMSVLDDFVRMRLYRERASEFELLAETEDSPDVRFRYRIVARHYRELAAREEKADKARMAERLERLRIQRQKPAAMQRTLSAESDAPQSFLIAAE